MFIYFESIMIFAIIYASCNNYVYYYSWHFAKISVTKGKVASMIE